MFRALREWLVGPPEPEGTTPTSEAPVPPKEPTAEEELEALAADPERPLETARVLKHVDVLARKGAERTALGLVARILASRRGLVDLALAAAERAVTRGDDAVARELLAPLLAEPEPALAALLLDAELAERAGDPTALARYERILARDVTQPQARARAARIRERRAPRAMLTGATLLGEPTALDRRWRVLAELGRGGAGTVFRARDLRVEREVALKVYHQRGREARERLRVEAGTAARLEHPSVVRILDCDEELCAVAMEALDGSTKQVASNRSVDVREVLAWMAGTAEVLAYLHARGLVHRDVKPSNLLLRGALPVLTDFGLAREQGATTQGDGSLGYMPPEQRAGAAAHPSADVYALGVSLRELLSSARGDVPAGIRELIAACVAEAPEARPSCAHLAAQLRR